MDYKINGHLQNTLTIVCLLLSIIIFNGTSLYFCNLMGCHEVNLSNLFRTNLICNACTDISYSLHKYQFEIYFAVGGTLITLLSNLTKDIISKINI